MSYNFQSELRRVMTREDKFIKSSGYYVDSINSQIPKTLP